MCGAWTTYVFSSAQANAKTGPCPGPCLHVELTTRWVDGKTVTTCDRCGERINALSD